MSRIHTFLTILVINLIAGIIHLVSVATFKPMQDSITSTHDLSAFNGVAVMVDIREAMVIWVPLIMVIGIFAWGFMREWRRQRETAVRTSRRRL